MILNNWNPAYKITSVIVEEGNHVALDPGVHEQLNRVLYAEGEGVERLDYPILAKLKQRYFTVKADKSVDPGYIELPAGDIEEMGLDAPERCRMLVAKRDSAPRIADMIRP